MALARPTEEERLALCEWLTANCIAPEDVPIESFFAVTDEPDSTRVIRYLEFVRDPQTGNIQADPEDRTAMKRGVTTPCIVEPPAWLNIPGGRP